MADLIERESLNKWCHETMKAQTTVEGMSYIRTFWDAVNAVPNVEAVPVVRCKDCKHFNLQSMECENDAISTDHEGGASYSLNFYSEDFCSYGERRNDDAAD